MCFQLSSFHHHKRSSEINASQFFYNAFQNFEVLLGFVPSLLAQQVLIILYLPLEAELHDEKREENAEIKRCRVFFLPFLNKQQQQVGKDKIPSPAHCSS